MAEYIIMEKKYQPVYTEHVESTLQQATFAGGCFWCLQGPFEAEPGVSKVEVGYVGGTPEDAQYEKVAMGQTQHREGIHFWYDPKTVTYEKLLEIFWRNIDPTDPNGQFADQGHQYTTAIYFHTPEQQQAAEQSKTALGNSGKFKQPIATVIIPFTTFFPAEPEHQRYYLKNPIHYNLYKEGSGRAGFIRKNWKKT